MQQKQYTTSELAASVGVHANTVRFYEQIGFLTKPRRRSNGYRIYTSLQLAQCALIRRAMKAEVLQNGLRKQAVEIIRRCAALDFPAARDACGEYNRMIECELANAGAAVLAVENIIRRTTPPEPVSLRRRDAAQLLQITPETLRTWERSGLLAVRRSENGYRVYHADDMQRLTVIRTLRCANYSLSAILRLMRGMERDDACSIEAVLNTPHADEEIISVCDRLISSLQSTRTDAQALLPMIDNIEQKYLTLQ